MDALELLKSDHDRVEGLFMQFEQGGNSQQFHQLFQQLFQELSVHSMIEEQIFYPEVAKFDETKSLLKDAYQEHGEVKAELAELAVMDNTTAEWGRKMTKLRNDVQHHVKDEETELFPKVRQMMAEQQLNDLGQKLQQAKTSSLESPLIKVPMQKMQQMFSMQDGGVQDMSGMQDMGSQDMQTM